MSDLSSILGSFTVEAVPFDSPDAQRLRAAARIEVDSLYHGYPDLAEPLTAANAAVTLVARDTSGTPLGCGSLVAVDDGVFELRRVFVRSEARGSGVAVALLRELEAAGRELGAPALVYETGAAQVRTIRFYEREGFYRIAPFGRYAENALSVCLAKPL
jgi:GNAT superfamily N-acetyltransferase